MNTENNFSENNLGHSTRYILPIDCRNGICVESTPREVKRILTGNHDAVTTKVKGKGKDTMTPRWVREILEEKLEEAKTPLFIYKSWCKRCGICIATCPFDALKWGSDDAPESIEDKCKKCYMCEYRCPESAITILQVRKKAGSNV